MEFKKEPKFLPKAEEKIEKVTLTSAVKDKTGLYRFSVKIVLKM